jgi:hypothetical protein
MGGVVGRVVAQRASTALVMRMIHYGNDATSKRNIGNLVRKFEETWKEGKEVRHD